MKQRDDALKQSSIKTIDDLDERDDIDYSDDDDDEPADVRTLSPRQNQVSEDDSKLTKDDSSENT